MRTLRLLLASVFLLGFSVVAAPVAPACACGAVPTRERALVTGETSLVTWDGKTETIDMIMRLGGRASEAAWIMPTPEGSELSLGNRDVWDDLRDLTRPEYRTRWDWTPKLPFGNSDGVGGAAPGGGARVEKVAEIGPFRVTTLAGQSASAVNDWLRENDYPTRDELLPTFQTYLDQGWRIQAVRLIPAAQRSLQDDLDPLRIKFATDRPHYPIALSRHASSTQYVALFIVAGHRMDITAQAAPELPLQLDFAGRVPGARVGQPGGLIPGTTDVFLTAYVGHLRPVGITQDFEFGQAARDDAYRQVIWRTDDTPGEVIGLALAGLVLLLGPVALVVGLVMMARRRAAH